MEKMISFPEKRVRDLGGLYMALKKAGYAVRNVGVDEFGTYVYLEDAEEKDPVGMIDEWAGKPAPTPSDKKAFIARKTATKEMEAADAAVRATEEAARVAALAAEKAVADAVADAAAQAEAAAQSFANGEILALPAPAGPPERTLLAPAPTPEARKEAPKESLWKRVKSAIW